jgi:hypothetical protein
VDKINQKAVKLSGKTCKWEIESNLFKHFSLKAPLSLARENDCAILDFFLQKRPRKIPRTVWLWIKKVAKSAKSIFFRYAWIFVIFEWSLLFLRMAQEQEIKCGLAFCVLTVTNCVLTVY